MSGSSVPCACAAEMHMLATTGGLLLTMLVLGNARDAATPAATASGRGIDGTHGRTANVLGNRVRDSAERGPDRPAVKALRFFEAMPTRNAGDILRKLRPPPISGEERARVLAALPTRGPLPVNWLYWYERPKLATLEPVLAYHERAGVFETKVFDFPEAIVALHERTVLLVSRQALRLLSGAELQAMVAHEVGHDFFWAEFERAFARTDHRSRQELELKCDGIALL